MAQGEVVDVFSISDVVLTNGSFGPNEIQQIIGAIARDFTQLSVLRDSVGELEQDESPTPATNVRLGVCYFLLGRYNRAVDTLGRADGGALAHYYVGRAHFANGNYTDAVGSFESAKKAGYDTDMCTISGAEATRYAGDPETAMKMLDELFGPAEQTADYLYQRGATIAALGGNPTEVCALYERAVESDGRHPGALFGLAMENDRRGNDLQALELYQRATGSFPAHEGSLLNLGVLYEDMNDYAKAQACYQRILDTNPGHPRARLYFKDAAASNDQYFDEEAQKRSDRMAQVLNIPVTDFELSVRSRNCLQKMGVMTLGDLTRTTEQELLQSKNFGETSLVEIRDMLSSKGLSLGQFAHEKSKDEPPVDTSSLPPDAQAMLDRPISDLNLSVRARKCMVRLSMNTIGELIRKSGDDLLECKNFGVTSLNEVREKLTVAGLKLRGD